MDLFDGFMFQTDIAMCISIGAAADLSGRCVLALLSSVVTLNTRCLFYMATLFTFFIRIGMIETLIKTITYYVLNLTMFYF